MSTIQHNWPYELQPKQHMLKEKCKFQVTYNPVMKNLPMEILIMGLDTNSQNPQEEQVFKKEGIKYCKFNLKLFHQSQKTRFPFMNKKFKIPDNQPQLQNCDISLRITCSIHITQIFFAYCKFDKRQLQSHKKQATLPKTDTDYQKS